MLLQNAVDEFILDKKVYCAPKTIKNYTEHLIRFQQYAPRSIEELTPAVIRGYIVFLKENNVRNVSINTYIRSVKVFCRWLQEFEYVETDLFLRIKLPRPDPAIKIPLSRDEVKSIDSVLNDRNKIIFHLMLDAGLRVQEVCSLKIKDVDLSNRLIYVHDSKYNKSRIVPLAACLVDMISKFKQKRNTEYLLCNKSGYQMTDNLIKQLFQKIKLQSGINRLHAHLLRHTFATSYIVGGGNLEKLRIMLGHADYNVTKTYLHLAAQFEIVKYPIYKLDPVFFEKGY